MTNPSGVSPPSSVADKLGAQRFWPAVVVPCTQPTTGQPPAGGDWCGTNSSVEARVISPATLGI
ncbi:hypothetical protein BEN49_02880 [Hymenobacter coccineus]|uniref:Uncharacterized protein n=1 Tax=Hymenobacter coccineus TaxID=1908235 RepID=A0A1G1SU31_9BACT|nr:hypothetical protein BEN49_02880 [Hymenobacter coccineus]